MEEIIPVAGVKADNIHVYKEGRVAKIVYDDKEFYVDFKERKVYGDDVVWYVFAYDLSEEEWNKLHNASEILFGRVLEFDEDFFIFRIRRLKDGILCLTDDYGDGEKAILVRLR